MSEFLEQGTAWACWAENAPTRVINVDAPAVEDSVFLATHHSRSLSRRRIDEIDTDVSAEAADQSDLLATFLEIEAPELLFIVLLGKSGTGKSHLVRWVLNEIQRRPDPRNHVVYIAKTDMSLRRVVELTIEGMTGPSIDKVRKSLEEVRGSISTDVAPQRLLEFLMMAVRDELAVAEPASQSTFLAVVYDLIRDPVFIDYVADDPAYAAHARQLVSRSRSPSTDPSFQFTPDVLPTMADLAEAGRSARQAATRCLNDSGAQAELCSVLNRLHPNAIRGMVGLAGTNLLQLFSEVRSLLAQEENGNKRLLLFIEDLTVLSGIEEDFADALTVPSTPSRRLCDLRVLAASTDENYLASPFWTKETVRTRTATSGWAYILDQTWESFGEQELQHFITRYLNAVRVGVDGLEAAMTSHGSDADWVPNACSDCELRSECHDLFGSANGIGLYPFNPEALLRIRDLIGAEFDPRKLLSGAREVLGSENRRLLLSGGFPPTTLDDIFRKNEIRAGQGIRINLATRIRNSYTPDQQGRVSRFVEFWGRSAVSDDLNALANAFGIDLEPFSRDRPPPPPPQPQPSGPPSRVNLLAEAIERWHQGQTLTGEKASEIRQLVFDHLRTAVLAADPLAVGPTTEWIKGRGGQFLTLHSIDLDNAERSGRDAAGSWSVRLQPTDLDDVRFLLGLVQYDQLGHWHFEEGPDHFRLYREKLETWTESLVDMIHHGGTAGSAPILEAICSSLVAGSTILGLARTSLTDPDKQLRVLLADESNVIQRSDDWGIPLYNLLGRPDQQAKRWDRGRLVDELLGRVGVRQGSTGKFRAVDGVEIIEALRNFPTRHLPTVPESAPEGLQGYWRKVPSIVEENLDSENSRVLREWRKYISDITQVSGDPRELPDVLKAVDHLVTAAHEAGVLGGVASRTAWGDATQTAETSHDHLVAAVDGLAEYSEASFWEKVQFISNDFGPILEMAANLADLCFRIATGTKEHMQHQADGGSQHIGVHDDLRQLVDDLDGAVTALERLR